MSAAYESISSAQPMREAAVSPATIAARMDRLPATRTMWLLVALISLGGWFELYDLFFTGYIAPGLARSGLLTNTTQSLFGLSGMGAFVAATFAGLFLGTFFLGFLSDRYGRRFVFTWSLLWYTAASAIMALQNTSDGLLLWRLIAGIGVGVEIVTIDAYIVEMVPAHMRGRAFALNQTVMFSSVPIVAVLAWQLVPISPLGLDGWRWVVLIGAAGAIVVWFIRRAVPESPRWLVQNDRGSEAERIVAGLEAKIAGEYGQTLPHPALAAAHARVVSAHIPLANASVAELFQPPYRSRLLMLVVFNLCQVVGFYGFANWVPTLLVAKGIAVTQGLGYAAIIAIANPVGPLLAMTFADRFDRKWVIVGAAFAVAVFGAGFAQFTFPLSLILCGALITVSNTVLSYAYHAYQVEIFPLRIRARAAGLAYSSSCIGAMASGFLIAFFLRAFGATGALGLITGCMIAIMLVIGLFGPLGRDLHGIETAH